MELFGQIVCQAIDWDTGLTCPFQLSFICLEADIGGGDLIISYRWLAQNHIDVMANKHGLMVQRTEGPLWIPGSQDAKGKAKVQAVEATSPPEEVEDIVHVDLITHQTGPKTTAVECNGEVFAAICLQLGVQPTVDYFADDTNAKCNRYITKAEDALSFRWPAHEVPWVNPPWTLWPQVVDHIRLTDCAVVALCPAKETKWVSDLLSMSSRRLFLEPGIRLFDFAGKKVQPSKCGMWALRIDKGPRNSTPLSNPMQRSKVIPAWCMVSDWARLPAKGTTSPCRKARVDQVSASVPVTPPQGGWGPWGAPDA